MPITRVVGGIHRVKETQRPRPHTVAENGIGRLVLACLGGPVQILKRTRSGAHGSDRTPFSAEAEGARLLRILTASHERVTAALHALSHPPYIF